ncbi:MAG: alanine--tRNA ligase [Planctomycetota bacterium]
MRAADIRSKFLEFFRHRGHEIVPSSPVVPHDDPTLLFANAGMNQFKAVFTGKSQRNNRRAASSQKCIRAGGKHNDLENVGYTRRHLTFFEMLGNFSFGDYFKSEACAWAWELVTKGYGLDPAQLWVTVFRDDDEARAIWRDEVGVPAQRIVGLGEKDNYWSMGDVGPCGPCSEIYIDRGAARACGPSCGLGQCECDRFLEFWNLVFMQFEQLPGGQKVPLPRPSIDTGMGLERMTFILQGVESVFDTDVLASLAREIARLTGRPAASGPEGTPHRVISDHIRSLSFAIADGAFPSNEERGYVLRRILRRAARYGAKLGMERPFIYELVDTLVKEMGAAYPELVRQKELIKRLVHSEEEQFGRTLKQGVARFDDEVASMRTSGSKLFPGATAFFLHDSCGFPIDLTEQMAREQGYGVDRPQFDTLMAGQRERSRGPRTFDEAVEDTLVSSDEITVTSPTKFTGYHELMGSGEVLAVSGDATRLRLILSATPFYGEGGGQMGDAGHLRGAGFTIDVTNTTKNEHGVFVHHGRLVDGALADVRTGARVRAEVGAARRLAIHRNHTATHLLHAALRTVLGTHVQQKGSLVAPDRLRFDLSHFARIGPDELVKIEELVQEQVLRDSELVINEQDKDVAVARGAMAFFGEKYGDRVRVVEIPGFSIELCGGAHVRRTGEIGGFLITTEGSVSSGVRRIEAITGIESLKHARASDTQLGDLATLLKVSRDEVAARVESIISENRELRQGKKAAPAGGGPDLIESALAHSKSTNGCEFIAAAWPNVPIEELLRVADALKRRAGRRVFILASPTDEGARFVVGHSDELPKNTIHAGKIAGEGARLLGGGGGGRPDLAQAGGKDAAKLPEALKHMLALAESAVAK